MKMDASRVSETTQTLPPAWYSLLLLLDELVVRLLPASPLFLFLLLCMENVVLQFLLFSEVWEIILGAWGVIFTVAFSPPGGVSPFAQLNIARSTSGSKPARGARGESEPALAKPPRLK